MILAERIQEAYPSLSMIVRSACRRTVRVGKPLCNRAGFGGRARSHGAARQWALRFQARGVFAAACEIAAHGPR